MRQYRYVGPKAIEDRWANRAAGKLVNAPSDVLDWLRETGQRLASETELIVTYVVDLGGRLLIADRHSEHVACAGGSPALAAGELTFAISKGSVLVVGVSNQSTGYCPEPASWAAVAAALIRAGLSSLSGFTLTCVFRKCPACGEKSVVKNGVFECLLCGEALPTEYNCQPVEE